jgi:hypothetical protein
MGKERGRPRSVSASSETTRAQTFPRPVSPASHSALQPTRPAAHGAAASPVYRIDRSVILTLILPGSEDDGSFAGTFVIRASVDVDASGDSFTGEYSGEFVMPDGTRTGEYGPGNVTGTRLRPEAMGTPAP